MLHSRRPTSLQSALIAEVQDTPNLATMAQPRSSASGFQTALTLQKCVTDWCALTQPIHIPPSLLSCSAGSYALFGHSMGAWIAWEVLQELSRRGLPMPLRLFVSGNRYVLSAANRRLVPLPLSQLSCWTILRRAGVSCIVGANRFWSLVPSLRPA